MTHKESVTDSFLLFSRFLLLFQNSLDIFLRFKKKEAEERGKRGRRSCQTCLGRYSGHTVLSHSFGNREGVGSNPFIQDFFPLKTFDRGICTEVLSSQNQRDKVKTG